MSWNHECVTCLLLGSCAETDTQKILTHFVCIRYEEVREPAIVRARCDVINQYGETGLRVLLSPQTATKEA